MGYNVYLVVYRGTWCFAGVPGGVTGVPNNVHFYVREGRGAYKMYHVFNIFN